MERASTDSRGTAAAPTANELAFAICHEVGNLLAGSRLEASLLDADAGAEALEGVAARIEAASARAGALLACIRPLLDPAARNATPTDPLDVLTGLRSGLDARLDARVSIDLRGAVDLPPARVPAEALHQLLIAGIYCALDSGVGASRVAVAAALCEGGVEFRIEDDGNAEPWTSTPQLRGAGLVFAIGLHLAVGFAASPEPHAGGDRPRLALAFPAA